MADDVTLPGTGDVIAADEISSKKYQRMKLTLGADGVNDGDVAAANPLPVVVDFSMLENLLRQLVQSSASPSGFDRSLGRARVTAVVESGTLSAVTNLTNMGTMPATQLAVHQNLSAWHACVRSRIT